MNARPQDTALLTRQITQLRGDPALAPHASIVVPVNAAADLHEVLQLAADIGDYRGEYPIEFILVINNYDPESPPAELEKYREMGFSVIAIPTVKHVGAIAIAARLPGIEHAQSDIVLQFDADCRIPNATALIDWYIAQIEKGADLAYTHVEYSDLPAGLAMKIRMFLHHASRWFRRVILGIPTSRGSNYAMRRSLALELYSRGALQYDILVGPRIKSIGGHIAYSGARELVVFTSGRFFKGGWSELLSYVMWRLGYYRRVGVFRSNGALHD
ncbi:MAG: glycosyltransferase [Anaerolineales bacterium]